MKTLALAITGFLLPTVAAAQVAPTSAAPPSPTVATAASPAVVTPPPPSACVISPPRLAAPDEEPQGRIGAELALLPIGTLKASAGDLNISGNTTMALGIGAVLQHPIEQHVTVELAPRMLFHVKGSSDDASATELDLRARVTAGGYVSPGSRLYLAFEPGYSVLFLPDNSSDVTSPNGFIAGFAMGAAFKAAPKMMVTTEIGYQFGFQKTTVGGMDVDLSASFLHLAVGMLFDL